MFEPSTEHDFTTHLLIGRRFSFKKWNEGTNKLKLRIKSIKEEREHNKIMKYHDNGLQILWIDGQKKEWDAVCSTTSAPKLLH